MYFLACGVWRHSVVCSIVHRCMICFSFEAGSRVGFLLQTKNTSYSEGKQNIYIHKQCCSRRAPYLAAGLSVWQDAATCNLTLRSNPNKELSFSSAKTLDLLIKSLAWPDRLTTDKTEVNRDQRFRSLTCKCWLGFLCEGCVQCQQVYNLATGGLFWRGISCRGKLFRIKISYWQQTSWLNWSAGDGWM